MPLDDSATLSLFTEMRTALQEIRGTLRDQNTVLSKTEQRVEDMSNRLLGNGQPGEIEKFHTALAEHIKADAISFNGVQNGIGSIRLWQNSKVKWFAGAVAVVSAEGLILSWWLTHHINTVSTMAGH